MTTDITSNMTVKDIVVRHPETSTSVVSGFPQVVVCASSSRPWSLRPLLLPS